MKVFKPEKRFIFTKSQYIIDYAIQQNSPLLILRMIYQQKTLAFDKLTHDENKKQCKKLNYMLPFKRRNLQLNEMFIQENIEMRHAM